MLKFRRGVGAKGSISQPMITENFQKLPLVEVYGNQRIMLENHRGVIEYSPERICVKVTYGCIRICGQSLFLSQMSSEQLVIHGQVHSIFFVKRGS